MNKHQRHLGRELALLWLYQVDVGQVSVDETLAQAPEGIEELADLEEEGIVFAQLLVRGIRDDRPRIDQAIAQYARGWSLERMAAIERNVLRIALFEILDLPDIPTSVSADEAVEIAKKYGAEESGKFVNGILGAYLRNELTPPPTA
jgi:N utilization substance protein B